jgi:hypothetical protein
MHFIRLDLPEPDFPVSPIISPSAIEKLMFFNASSLLLFKICNWKTLLKSFTVNIFIQMG